MFKNILVGAVVGAVLIGSGVALAKSLEVGSINSIVKAVSGPDTYFPYVANNNLQKYGVTQPFASGSTTVCSIKSPAATSTLVFGSASFAVASTVASIVTLAQSTSPSASTTPLTLAAIAANAQGTVMASSSPLLATGLINSLVFAPSTFFNVVMTGGAGTFSPVGTCSAEFVRN